MKLVHLVHNLCHVCIIVSCRMIVSSKTSTLMHQTAAKTSSLSTYIQCTVSTSTTTKGCEGKARLTALAAARIFFFFASTLGQVLAKLGHCVNTWASITTVHNYEVSQISSKICPSRSQLRRPHRNIY